MSEKRIRFCMYVDFNKCKIQINNCYNLSKKKKKKLKSIMSVHNWTFFLVCLCSFKKNNFIIGAFHMFMLTKDLFMIRCCISLFTVYKVHLYLLWVWPSNNCKIDIDCHSLERKNGMWGEDRRRFMPFATRVGKCIIKMHYR